MAQNDTPNPNAPALVHDDDLLRVTVRREGIEVEINEELSGLPPVELQRQIGRAAHHLGTVLIYDGGAKLMRKVSGYNVPAGHKAKEGEPICTIVWRGPSLQDTATKTRIVPQAGCDRIPRGEWDLKIGQALQHCAYERFQAAIDAALIEAKAPTEG